MERVEYMNLKEILNKSFQGQTVLITGHTGFKGGWLSLWLDSLGAKVIGYSLEPPTKPSFFQETYLEKRILDIRGDILDLCKISQILNEYQPTYIFHLAAQPLVRSSYKNPLETFNANIMGTANILEAIRLSNISTTCVCITSDKCYENREWDYAYRENDALGGFDPYSASKGAAEIIIASYRNSFFNPKKQGAQISVSSARAGNVIGGGDWAEDRIIPDCIKALSEGKVIQIRNPHAIRPWQYVLDPLCGYLCLAIKMKENPDLFSGAWNFGPSFSNNIDVKMLVELLIHKWGSGHYEDVSKKGVDSMHEAHFLKLDITKSVTKLMWRPVYNIEDALQKTVESYKIYYSGEQDLYDFSKEQIEIYMRDASNNITNK